MATIWKLFSSQHFYNSCSHFAGRTVYEFLCKSDKRHLMIVVKPPRRIFVHEIPFGKIPRYQPVSSCMVSALISALTSRAFQKHLTYTYMCFNYIIVHTSVTGGNISQHKIKCIVLSTQTSSHLHALSVNRYMSFRRSNVRHRQ